MQAFGYSIFLVHVSSIERMRFIESVVKKKKERLPLFSYFFLILSTEDHPINLKFQRNCGAASDEDYNRVIKYYQLS